MARQYLVPGWGYINEVDTRQHLIPQRGFINTTQTVVPPDPPPSGDAINWRLVQLRGVR